MSDDSSALFEQAWRLHQAGQFDQAEPIYERALALAPDSPRALHGWALLAFDRGQLTAAIERLERAIKLDPRQAAFHVDLAQAFGRIGRPHEAGESYRRALELSPNHAIAHNNLGNLFFQSGQIDQAAECYRSAIAADPRLPDAHNNLGTVCIQQGQHDAAVTHLQRAIELRGDHVGAWLNLAGAFEATAQWKAAIEAYRAAQTLAPRLAEIPFRLAAAYAHAENRPDAIAAYERALELKPNWPQAHLALGVQLDAESHRDLARRHYLKALELDPELADAAYNLGSLEQDLGNSVEAEKFLARAIQLDPHHWQAHYHAGQEHSRHGRADEALACYERVIAINHAYPGAHFNRALCWLQQGNFLAGWREYEWRFQCPWFEYQPLRQSRWDGSPLEGRTLLVHDEQGIGDTLQFVRYLPLVAAQGPVISRVRKQLVPLLAGSSLSARFLGRGDVLPRYDVYIPLMSLPRIFETTLESIPCNIPYLAAEPERTARWRRELSGISGLRIGVNWKGREDNRDQSSRSVPLEQVARLATVPGVQLISLQKPDARAADKNLSLPPGAIKLPDGFDADGAFLDTAAVMQCLDLVITSDTAIAHLAGALGRPVWVLLCPASDWRWLLDRDDSPWYPTMRLFRHRAGDDWASVVERVAVALASLAG